MKLEEKESYILQGSLCTHLYTWLERDYVQEYSFVGYRNNNTFRDQPPTTDPLIA